MFVNYTSVLKKISIANRFLRTLFLETGEACWSLSPVVGRKSMFIHVDIAHY